MRISVFIFLLFSLLFVVVHGLPMGPRKPPRPRVVKIPAGPRARIRRPRPLPRTPAVAPVPPPPEKPNSSNSNRNQGSVTPIAHGSNPNSPPQSPLTPSEHSGSNPSSPPGRSLTPLLPDPAPRPNRPILNPVPRPEAGRPGGPRENQNPSQWPPHRSLTPVLDSPKSPAKKD
ncbi:hypothetical protein BDQ17DRAFT_1426545 [Cyathus striatus]|nr:hypothetical protein BDQ17DRAFT_1426545 [Cyathus striatus]